MAARLSDTDRLCSDSGYEESALNESLCGTYYDGTALQQQLETACRQGNGQELSRIVQALERGEEDVLSVLNARRGRNGNTFLHLAVAKGSVECVKQLLRKGADCLQKNKGGRTPLDLVMESSQSKATGRKGAYIVRVLQSAGTCMIIFQTLGCQPHVALRIILLHASAVHYKLVSIYRR